MARSAEEIDLDLFDVDLEGLGPVAAFQIRETAVECCKAYQIYSLEKPVQPVRTLRGGTFYGADTDLDGRVEIWAEDRAAIDGFEGLNQAEIKYAPTYILRFEQGRLVDASQQFKDHFDGIIAELHKTISADDLRTFRESDGSFGNSIGNIDQWRRMRKLKIQVLEMVWAYLYSGREKEAWNTLAVMWPAADTQRVQTAIAKARSAGILRQIDGESNLPRRKKRVQVFDVSANTQQGTSYAIMEPGTGMATTTGPGYDKSEVKKAQPIQLWRPMPADLNRVFSGQEELLDLLIDSTGKVRSAKWTMTKIPPDEALLADAVTWKFIPAHRHGKSVASRMRFAVQPKR